MKIMFKERNCMRGNSSRKILSGVGKVAIVTVVAAIVFFALGYAIGYTVSSSAVKAEKYTFMPPLSEGYARIILVRHGETDWSVAGKLQGQKDIPLNAKGIEEAKALAERLSLLRGEVAAIYSGDLISRCVQTANILSEKLGVQVKTMSELREMDVGEWVGLTVKEVAEKYPDQLKNWVKDPAANPPPGGESTQDLRDRCFKALDEIAKENAGKIAVVVTHGGVIKTIICDLLGIPPSSYGIAWGKIDIEEVSITVIDYKVGGKGKILVVNNIMLPLEE